MKSKELGPRKGVSPRPRCLQILWSFFLVFSAEAALGPAPGSTQSLEPGSDKEWTLEDCLNTARSNNHRKSASQFGVAMAEAQHRQSLSGYWPRITARGGYERTDEAPNFIFPEGQMFVPSQSIDVPGGTALVTIPANAFGPGFPPTDVQLPVDYPGQTIDTPSQLFPIPAQDIQLMDRDSFMASLEASWLLFDGGMRGGFRQQTRGNLELARQEARRTELEIADSVYRMYYGSVLARQILEVTRETLARMEATLSLTETMYKEGSGRVKKTDYLENKVMVETLRSTLAIVEKNEELARAALANTMGMPWNTTVTPAAKEIPFRPLDQDLEALVGTAYRFSPDWGRFEAGVEAGRGMVKTARSEYFPRIALTGNLHKWWNDYEAGMATDRNKGGWSIGLGMELPLFDGFLRRNKISEANAHLNQIQENGILLKDGIGLQVRDTVLGLEAAQKRYQATLDAMTAAEENRDLNTRAYQNDLVETEDVIQAQLIEALMKTQHLRMRYEHVALLSRLDLVVGTEVNRQLGLE